MTKGQSVWSLIYDYGPNINGMKITCIDKSIISADYIEYKEDCTDLGRLYSFWREVHFDSKEVEFHTHIEADFFRPVWKMWEDKNIKWYSPRKIKIRGSDELREIRLSTFKKKKSDWPINQYEILTWHTMKEKQLWDGVLSKDLSDTCWDN